MHGTQEGRGFPGSTGSFDAGTQRPAGAPRKRRRPTARDQLAGADQLAELRGLSQAALNQAPRFKLGVMAHDSYWLAARLERARGEAQVRRLLLLALEAFNEKPRFAVPTERTDSYAIAARLDRWVAAPTPTRGS